MSAVRRKKRKPSAGWARAETLPVTRPLKRSELPPPEELENLSTQDLKDLQRDRESNSRMAVVLLVLTGLVVLICALLFVKWMVYTPMISDYQTRQKQQAVREKIAKKRRAQYLKNRQQRQDISSACIFAASELLESLRTLPPEEGLFRCDVFFQRFPEPKNPKESQWFERIRTEYEKLGGKKRSLPPPAPIVPKH